MHHSHRRVVWFCLPLLLAGCNTAPPPDTGDDRAAPDLVASKLPAGVFSGDFRTTAALLLAGQSVPTATERETRTLTINDAGLPLRPDTGQPETIGANATVAAAEYRVSETTRTLTPRGGTLVIEYDAVIEYPNLLGNGRSFTLSGVQTLTYTLLEDGTIHLGLRLDATAAGGDAGPIGLTIQGSGVLRRV